MQRKFLEVAQRSFKNTCSFTIKQSATTKTGEWIFRITATIPVCGKFMHLLSWQAEVPDLLYYSIKVTALNDQLFMFKAYLKTTLMLEFYLRLWNVIFVGSFFFLLFVHAFCFFDVDCFDFPLDLLVLDLLLFLVVVFLALGDNWNVELPVLTEDVADGPDWWDPKDARIVTCKYEIKKKKKSV